MKTILDLLIKKGLPVIFSVLFFVPKLCLAYNFLYLHPDTAEPVKWDTSQPIRYWLDPGPLGQLSNEQVHTLLTEAMKIWENASSFASPPRFEFAGYLPEDVNGTNYQKYVSLFPCYTADLDACASESQKNLQTVIILDEDGSILGSELCRITNCAANAGAKVFFGSQNDPQGIAQGIVVLGPYIGSGVARINAVVGVMVHELGHLLGIAHPDLNQQKRHEGEIDLGRFIPTMFYSAVPVSNAPNDKYQVTLNPDDKAGISALYPASISPISATIKGRILKSDDSPMIHVNVIARNTNDPICEAYSFLSGRSCKYATSDLCESSGNDDSSYEIAGLPPGEYTIEVEEVDSNIVSTVAPGLIDPFIYGDAEFWNEGDIADEPTTLFTTITLAPGEIRENVDIILNRSEVTDSRILYIPLDAFTQGPDTNCPKEPPMDYAALIGIDEPDDEPIIPPPSPSSGGCNLIRN